MANKLVTYIFVFFIAVGALFSIVTGNIESLNSQILKGGLDGINLLLDMMPLLVLWTCIMQIY